ncbi:cytochrome c oxidase subunit II [Pseudooceanicola sp.]|uniref:cytochrome c oxidase subunit II n=1 Tax=Pseudooceanicola sp. TaxID=1914328 RepID=UPI00405A25A6
MHPAGPAAAVIATLWWVLLAGATAIFLFVAGLIAFAWRRPPGDRDERGFVIGLGLAFPLAVLAALLVYGLVVGERLLPRPGPDVVTVRAEARQWAWRFGYGDAPGRQTEGVMHIPAGRPVDVEITTADVIHAFWVPRLAGKLDAVPGHVNVLRIEADAPGRYAGLSGEYSGPGYREHRFTVIAHDAAAWQRFLQGETP